MPISAILTSHRLGDGPKHPPSARPSGCRDTTVDLQLKLRWPWEGMLQSASVRPVARLSICLCVVLMSNVHDPIATVRCRPGPGASQVFDAAQCQANGDMISWVIRSPCPVDPTRHVRTIGCNHYSCPGRIVVFVKWSKPGGVQVGPCVLRLSGPLPRLLLVKVVSRVGWCMSDYRRRRSAAAAYHASPRLDVVLFLDGRVVRCQKRLLPMHLSITPSHRPMRPGLLCLQPQQFFGSSCNMMPC